MSPGKMQSRYMTALAFIKAGWWIWSVALAVAIMYPGADDILAWLYMVILFHLLRYNYWSWNGNERLRAKQFGPPPRTWPPHIGIVNSVVFVALLAIGGNTSRPLRLTLFFIGFASAIFWLKACCNAFCWWVREQATVDIQQSPIRGKCTQQEANLNDKNQETELAEVQEVR